MVLTVLKVKTNQEALVQATAAVELVAVLFSQIDIMLLDRILAPVQPVQFLFGGFQILQHN
jgi:hypothetical protein